MSATVEADISGDNIFVEADGRLGEPAYVEIVAQAIAAQHGFRTMGREGQSDEGFLIGVKDFEITGRAKVGDRLRVHVRKLGKFGEFGIVHGTVQNGEATIAEGEIKIWQKGLN